MKPSQSRADALRAREAYARLVEQAYGWPERQHGQGRVWRRPLLVQRRAGVLHNPRRCVDCETHYWPTLPSDRRCGARYGVWYRRKTHRACLVLVGLVCVVCVAWLAMVWGESWWPFTPSGLASCDVWNAGATTEYQGETWFCTPQKRWKRASEWEKKIALGLRLWPCPHGHVFGGEDKGCVRLPEERATPCDDCAYGCDGASLGCAGAPTVVTSSRLMLTNKQIQPQPELPADVELWTDFVVHLPLHDARLPSLHPAMLDMTPAGHLRVLFAARQRECVLWHLDPRVRVMPNALTLHFTMEVATSGQAAMMVFLNGYAAKVAHTPVPPTLGFVQKMVIPLSAGGLGERPVDVPVTQVQLCRHVEADTAVGELAVHAVRLEP